MYNPENSLPRRYILMQLRLVQHFIIEESQTWLSERQWITQAENLINFGVPSVLSRIHSQL